MDAIMKITVQVQTAAAVAALAKMETALGGIGTAAAGAGAATAAAGTEAEASLTLWQTLLREVAQAAEAYREAILTVGVAEAQNSAARGDYVLGMAQQLEVQQALKAAQAEAAALLGDYAAITFESAAAQVAYRDALASSAAGEAEVTAARIAYMEALTPELEIQAALKSARAEVAAQFAVEKKQVAETTEALGPYKVLLKDIAAAEMALRDAMVAGFPAYEQEAALTEKLIGLRSIEAEIVTAVAAAKTAAKNIGMESIAVEEKEIAVLGPWKTLTSEVAAAELALRDALVAEGSSLAQTAGERNLYVGALKRQLAVEGELKIAQEIAAAGSSPGRLAGWLTKVKDMGAATEKWGKTLQWTGRQIEYRITLPLLLAGAAATKFALDNERAFTELKKVYGPAGSDIRAYAGELALLRKGFVLLSNEFGVNQAEVIEIGTLWAQAGASGIALARATRLTLEAMILGDLSYKDAANALIVLKNQYSLTTEELKTSLAAVTVISNMTAASFGDFITSIIRGGSTARTAGVDMRHYAALVAAIVPAAGTAAQAGNSLKTIFSRLMAPTRQAADLMKELGINIHDQAWQSLTGEQRILRLADAYKTLTPAQRSIASTVLAGRFQISRFDALIRDIINPLGNYHKALRASANESKNLAQYNRELIQVLSSDPKKFSILWTQLQNALADIILPMLPAIEGLIGRIVNMATAFSHLSPRVQQFILMGLGMVAVLGPIFGTTGAIVTLMGRLASSTAHAAEWVLNFATKLLTMSFANTTAAGSAAATTVAVEAEAVAATEAAASTGLFAASLAFGEAALAAWPILLLAVGAALAFVFRDQLGSAAMWVWGTLKDIGGWFFDLVGSIADSLGFLPDIFISVFRGVVNIVSAAVEQVYELFSYLNPFAKHSPSLVDNVQAGAEVIGQHYKDMGRSGRHLRKVKNDIRAVGHAVAGLPSKAVIAVQTKLPHGIKGLAKGGTTTSAGSVLVGEQGAEVLSLPKGATVTPLGAGSAANAATTASTNAYKSALKALDAEIHAHEVRLHSLTETMHKYKDALDEAKQHLKELQDTPITGMRAMEEQIFRNTQAQNEQRLSILKLEQVYGSIDKLKSHYAELNGEIELLSGRKLDLHNLGAGSDVTGGLDARISQLKGQQGGIADIAKKFDDANAALDRLQATGERLDLEKHVKFDPITHAIEAFNDTLKEVPWPKLRAELIAQQAEVKRLTAQYNASKAAVDAEAAAIQKLRDARKGLTAGHSTAAKAPGDSLLGAAGASTFKDPGNLGIDFGKESGDLKALVDQWSKDMQDKLGKLDIFAPMKAKWDGFTAWLRTHALQSIVTVIGAIAGAIAVTVIGAIAGIPLLVGAAIGGALALAFVVAGPYVWDGIRALAGIVWDAMKLVVGKVWDALKSIGSHFSGFGRFLAGIGSAIYQNAILPIIHAFGKMIDPIKGALGIIGSILGAFVVVWRGIFLLWLSIVTTAIRGVAWIISTVMHAILEAWRGAWGLVIAVLRNVWNVIKGVVVPPLMWIKNIMSTAWNDVKNNAKTAWNGITSVFRTVWGAIKKVFNPVKEYFAGIWNGLGDGLEGMMNSILGVFEAGINGIIHLINAVIRGWNLVPFHDDVPTIDLVHIKRVGEHKNTADSPSVRHAAMGAITRTAGSLWVGETGKELLTLPAGAQVTPLPYLESASKSGGGTTNHFHGPMVFPNVTNGDDAEAFVRNLESMADA